MREIEHLQKQWRDSAGFRGLHASMTLENDALVLGADTILVKRDSDGTLAIDGEEERLLTLLSVAHGQPIGASILKSFRRASDCAKTGVWFFAEAGAAAESRTLFDADRKLKKIQVIYLPMPGWSQ